MLKLFVCAFTHVCANVLVFFCLSDDCMPHTFQCFNSVPVRSSVLLTNDVFLRIPLTWITYRIFSDSKYVIELVGLKEIEIQFNRLFCRVRGLAICSLDCLSNLIIIFVYWKNEEQNIQSIVWLYRMNTKLCWTYI